jgi:tetratricopeptide (TPR) repeat protein
MTDARRQPRPKGDRLNRLLLGAVLALIVSILGMLVWMLVSGLAQPQAPRTAVERDIYQAEAQIKAKPKDVLAWTTYAEALVRAGRYADAQVALQKGEAAVGKQPAFVVSAARIYQAEGDLAKAVSETQRAVVLALEMRKKKVEELAASGAVPDPKAFFTEEIVAAEVLAAEIGTVQGRFEDVVAAYTRALEQTPTMADVLVARGDAYVKLKRYDEARADYDKALSFGPDYQPALDGLKNLKAVSGQ